MTDFSVDNADALTGMRVVNGAFESSPNADMSMSVAEAPLLRGVYGEDLVGVTEMMEGGDGSSGSREHSTNKQNKNETQNDSEKTKTAEPQLENKNELPNSKKTHAEPQLEKMQSELQNQKNESEQKTKKTDLYDCDLTFTEPVPASTDSMEHFQDFEPSNPNPRELSERLKSSHLQQSSATFIPAILPVEHTASSDISDSVQAIVDTAEAKKKEECVEEKEEEQDSQETVVDDDPAVCDVQVQHE
jgi:hypothetical protein